MSTRYGRIWSTPTGFAASHCQQCAMGWSRVGQAGGVLTICLLDREPVLSEMVSCDRFEAKEEAQSSLPIRVA